MMKEYVFSFSNLIEYDGEKYDCLDDTAHGIYDSEEEAIADAMEMYEYYGHEFTHLFVGQPEYFTPRVDADLVLGDLATTAYDNGYKDDEYLTNVKHEHIKELDKLLTEVYLAWENKHPEYRNSYYLMTHPVRYSISQLKEEMDNMRKGEQHE